MLAGWLTTVSVNRTGRFRVPLVFLACLIASLLTVHPLGVAGLVVNAGLDPVAALVVDAVYLPGDVVKNLLVAVLGAAVHRAFPRLLPSSGSRPGA